MATVEPVLTWGVLAYHTFFFPAAISLVSNGDFFDAIKNKGKQVV